MKIQIDGINTQNKGAELMLIAILERLQTRYPGATVFLNPDAPLDMGILPTYNLKVVLRIGLKLGRYVNGVFGKLKIKQPFNYFKENYASPDVDMILDASGFKFSDQWNRSTKWLDSKEKYYANAKSKGTKIYFLTQALGPFDTENGKRSMKILSDYSNLIFSRDELSYKYALDAGADSVKLKESCDFTFEVKGAFPSHFEHLRNGIAMIPNKKMITHAGNESDKYLSLFLKIIRFFENKGERVFLLNHEGKGDFAICNLINSHCENKLDIVSNVSAKEVKGIIGASKMVISSRFHGVASSLSQAVPCVATSWNHKYEMLFKGFNQSNCILNANAEVDSNIAIVKDVYGDRDNVKATLKSMKPSLLKQIDGMWDMIFEDYERASIN